MSRAFIVNVSSCFQSASMSSGVLEGTAGNEAAVEVTATERALVCAFLVGVSTIWTVESVSSKANLATHLKHTSCPQTWPRLRSVFGQLVIGVPIEIVHTLVWCLVGRYGA